jgi:hypothetical protein
LNNSALSTFINPHDLNIEDSKLVNMINTSRQFKNESNFSQKDTTINPHELNIESNINTALVNDTNEIISVNEYTDAINKHELNIDIKSESLLSNNTQPCSKSKQFDFLRVKKVMIIVKPIDISLLKSMTKPKNEAKRVQEITNTNDSKVFISDQTFTLINHMYNCNYVQSNGVKCNFATPYISYYKQHLKNKGHTEQENLSQADVLVNPQILQSSYNTSSLSESNRYQKIVQSSQNSSKSNRNNFSKNNNIGSRSNNQRQAKGSGNYYSAQKNGKNK